ncbi:MAG: AI-2E family transporter [Acidobacteriota bacterium]|nr:AI-2E family transporter [Acidobacteriota bacterium]
MSRLTDRIDRRYAKVCVYAGVTVVLTLAACLLLHTALPVFAKLWELVCAVVEPLVYGAALSYVLNPLVTRVSYGLRRYRHYEGPHHAARRRSAAVLVSMVLMALLVLAITTVFVLMVTHSLSGLSWETVQALLGDAQGDFMKFMAVAESSLEEWGLVSIASESSLLAALTGAKNVATTMVFAVIFAVYFLIDAPRVAGYLGRVVRTVLGGHALDLTRVAADADRVFSGYFRGQGIDALVVGVLSGIVLTVIGVPYAPVVGLLAGLGNLIPYVGGPVGFGSIALMCLADAAWDKMLWGFVGMAVVMFVDANVINPRLLSDNVEVHPILVVAALIAGGAVGGIAGMLVAVPTAAFLKTQLDRWMASREAAGGPTVTDEPDGAGHQTRAGSPRA